MDKGLIRIMGIYIKGISKLPEDEGVTISIDKDGSVWVGNDESVLIEEAEAIIIPPHGDLIDLSTVNLEDGPYEYQDWVEWALEQYQDAPTFLRRDL